MSEYLGSTSTHVALITVVIWRLLAFKMEEDPRFPLRALDRYYVYTRLLVKNPLKRTN